MGMHHKLCHALGGAFNLPHAAVHTIILPSALAYNAAAAPQAMQRIALALNAGEFISAPQAVFDLAKSNGVAVSLKDLGMKPEGLAHACDLALKNQHPDP